MPILLSAVFLLIAGAIWFVLLRPVPTHATQGVIAKKTYKPPGEYTQYPAGMRKGSYYPTIIPIAEGYVIEVDLDDSPRAVTALLNAVEAERFDVGSRVELEYSLRSIPGVWSRCYVHSVRLADTSSPE